MATISKEQRAERDAREMSRWEPIRRLGAQIEAENRDQKIEQSKGKGKAGGGAEREAGKGNERSR